MSDPMKAIADLEKAQAQFKRDESRKKKIEALLTDPRKATVELTEAALAMTPRRQREAMAETLEKIARDTTIPNGRVQDAAREAATVKIAEWRAENDNIRYALGQARKQLNDKSNPFGSEEMLTRYMLELQIVGTPQTKAEVVDAVQKAAAGNDIGAVQFWAKHARALFAKAEGNGSPADLNETLGTLEAGIHELRNLEQRQAFNRLQTLDSCAAELEKALNIADMIEEPTLIGEVRERTDQETAVAEQRERLARYNAGAAAAQKKIDEHSAAVYAARDRALGRS